MRYFCSLILVFLTACGIHPQQADVIAGFSRSLDNNSENAAQMLQWHSDNSQQLKLALSALDGEKQALNCQARQLSLRPVQCSELERPISQVMLAQRLQVLHTCQLYARSLNLLITENDLTALNKSLRNLNAALAQHAPDFSAGQQQALADLSTQITGWFVARERYQLAQKIIRELGPLVNQILEKLTADLVLNNDSVARGFIDSHQRLAQNLLDETQQRLSVANKFSLTERSWLFEQQYFALRSLQRIDNDSASALNNLHRLQRLNQTLIEKIQQQAWDKQTWLELGKEIQQLASAIQVSGVIHE